jgi:hypothetical protein
MPINMTMAEREASDAIQAAQQALARALELSERADYGTQIMDSLRDAHKQAAHALDTAMGRV